MAEERKSLLVKLDGLEARYSELERQISDPAVAGDHNRLIALSKEQGRLKNIVARYREYKKTVTGIEDAEQILKNAASDEELKALAKEEINELEPQKQKLLEEIENTLVMADDMAVN